LPRLSLAPYPIGRFVFAQPHVNRVPEQILGRQRNAQRLADEALGEDFGNNA
jgi:hypothetical protein